MTYMLLFEMIHAPICNDMVIMVKEKRANAHRIKTYYINKCIVPTLL